MGRPSRIRKVLPSVSFFLLPSYQLQNYCSFAFYKSAFTKEECEQILKFYEAGKEVRSTVGAETETGSLFTPEPVAQIRRSKNVWLPATQDNAWVFDKLGQLAVQCNIHRYNFQLTGFLEPVQLTKYEEGDKYSWHQDNGNGKFSGRKLSVVLQLSDPTEYEGGDLQFFDETTQLFAPRDQGTVVFFPAFNLHRVTPIIKGTRHSAVAWIGGEPYR